MSGIAGRIVLASLAVAATAIGVMAIGVLAYGGAVFEQLMVEHGETVAAARAMFDQTVSATFGLAGVVATAVSLALALLLARRIERPLGQVGRAARRRRRPLRACPSHRPRGDPLVGGLLQPDGRAPRGTGAVPARVHRERGARAAHPVDEPPGLPRGAARRGHAARPRHVRVPA